MAPRSAKRPIWMLAALPSEVRDVKKLDPQISVLRGRLRVLVEQRDLIMHRCATRSWRHRHPQKRIGHRG